MPVVARPESRIPAAVPAGKLSAAAAAEKIRSPDHRRRAQAGENKPPLLPEVAARHIQSQRMMRVDHMLQPDRLGDGVRRLRAVRADTDEDMTNMPAVCRHCACVAK